MSNEIRPALTHRYCQIIYPVNPYDYTQAEMIQVNGLYKAYGERSLFEDVSFTLAYGEKLGIVGRNGSGKSTLFKLILGQEQPDDGEIVFPRDYKCGHLAQHLEFHGESILADALAALPQHDGSLDYKAKIVLSGLGFSEGDMLKPAAEFSGGFQIRVELARVLLSEPDLLLLDEPTNYLDIVSLRWLERFLSQWKRELMVISHDRNFMDRITTHSMLIRRCTVRKIKGNTGKLYLQTAQEDLVYQQTRENLEAERAHLQAFIDRFRAKASKASLVQSKIKALERLGTMDALEQDASLDFKFREAPCPGKVLLEAENLSFDYRAESARNTPELIKDFSLRICKGDRIGVIGKNGKGKSTLLRLLASELQPTSGEQTVSVNTQTGYFGQTNIARLSPELSVESEIQSTNPQLSRTQIRNICGLMMFSGDDAMKQTRVLSGGEKSRVLLGKLLARPCNLLLLDEPTNHLDMESVEALVESLKGFGGAIVIVTHNEWILRSLCTRLVVFQENGPELLEGDYDRFLEKVGWSDEAGSSPTGSTNRTTQPGDSTAEDPRAQRRQRAQSRANIRPLQKEVQRIERIICELEEKVKFIDEELITASQAGEGARIAALSKDRVAILAEIETSFDGLTLAYEKLKEAE